MNDTIEKNIQVLMRRSSPVAIDGKHIYILNFRNNIIVRYVENDNQVTFDCHEKSNASFGFYWLPEIIRELIRKYPILVVDVPMPIRWDNTGILISEDKFDAVIRVIALAVERKYSKCEAEYHPCRSTENRQLQG